MECPDCHANTYRLVKEERCETAPASPGDIWSSTPRYIREYGCSSCGYVSREEPGSGLLTHQPSSTNNNAQVDPMKLQHFMQQVKEEQNLPFGLIAGIVAAGVAAIVWAVITVLIDRQIGWMAIGVGFLVGVAVRQFGRGTDSVFGIGGAALSLLGCLAGNLLAVAIIVSEQGAVSLVAVLLVFLTAPESIVEVLQATFDPIDLLFYGLALYEGYRFSFRTITKTEAASLLRV